jgi:hypothetical protein
MEVFAKRGPLAGQRVEIPDEDVEAATAEDGWALKLEPGTVLEIDPAYAYDPKWKIPGYDPPDTGKKAKEPKAEDKK